MIFQKLVMADCPVIGTNTVSADNNGSEAGVDV